MFRVADLGPLFAGGSPAASYFSCAAKKSNQKKAAPVSRACAFPVLLDEPGGCGTRSRYEKTRIERARAQTVLAEFPDPPALLGGSQGVAKAHSVVN